MVIIRTWYILSDQPWCFTRDEANSRSPHQSGRLGHRSDDQHCPRSGITPPSRKEVREWDRGRSNQPARRGYHRHLPVSDPLEQPREDKEQCEETERFREGEQATEYDDLPTC